VASVKHVADIMGEITAASEEQSSGIEEVSRAITQMDEMTQQNAALVEQAAAAAESMQEQAVKLAQAVATFKLDRGALPAAELVVPKPAPVMGPVVPAVAAARPVATRTAAVTPRRAPTPGSSATDEWEEF
jgi:hypothetical protein